MATAMTQDWQDAWTAALDALELDVTQVEAMLADEHRNAETAPADLWRPPTEPGALPLELARADEILTRLLRVAEEIARRLTANRQQMAMTSRIETGEMVKRPVYVDRAMRSDQRKRPGARPAGSGTFCANLPATCSRSADSRPGRTAGYEHGSLTTCHGSAT